MKPILALAGVLCLSAVATAQAPAAPAAKLNLLDRQARATPERVGFTHTGAGNIDVAQPSPDTVVVTMTGVAVAGGHPCKHSLAALVFDLEQCFEVAYDPKAVKNVRLTLEGRLIGLLRSHEKGGSAQVGCSHAAVTAGGGAPLDISMPAHAVHGGENLSINDHAGPESVLVSPGRFTLHQHFSVSASHPRSLLPCKAASAEFAPDPALDPLWISSFEPFHGAAKKDFGLQVILKVTSEEADKPDDKKDDKDKK
jgi:hypothetical protein